MSLFLDNMQRDHALRLRAFEGMLAHLELDPDEATAPLLLSELRTALKSCASCETPGRCSTWCDEGHPGTPYFCDATQAFRNLMLAKEALKIRAA